MNNSLLTRNGYANLVLYLVTYNLIFNFSFEAIWGNFIEYFLAG